LSDINHIMPVKSPKDLTQSLKQGTIEPVYFLFGPETYLRDEAARAIADEALRGTLLREFNESSFNLLSDDVRSAVAIAEQLPMMSDRRVVRIRNFGKIRDADEEVLLNYLNRPVETSVVVFVTEDIDKRKKLAKSLMAGAAFEFQPLKMNELQTWLRSHLRKLKTEIEPQAQQRILEMVTSDLRTLTATGASSFTRRELTAATAFALALGGAVLGTVAAYVAAIGYAWDNPLDGLSGLSSVPARQLLFIVVGMPVIAAVVGWLLAGREPSTISRQPLE
jgi:replication-associated recombination protein RarA